MLNNYLYVEKFHLFLLPVYLRTDSWQKLLETWPFHNCLNNTAPLAHYSHKQCEIVGKIVMNSTKYFESFCVYDVIYFLFRFFIILLFSSFQNCVWISLHMENIEYRTRCDYLLGLTWQMKSLINIAYHYSFPCMTRSWMIHIRKKL